MSPAWTVCEHCAVPAPTGAGHAATTTANAMADDYFVPSGALTPVRVTTAPAPKRRWWPLVAMLGVVGAVAATIAFVAGARDDEPASAAEDGDAQVLAPVGAGEVGLGDIFRVGAVATLQNVGMSVQATAAEMGDLSTVTVEQLQSWHPELTVVGGGEASGDSDDVSVQVAPDHVVLAVRGGPGGCEYLRVLAVAGTLSVENLSLRTDAACTAAGAPADGWSAGGAGSGMVGPGMPIDGMPVGGIDGLGGIDPDSIADALAG